MRGAFALLVKTKMGRNRRLAREMKLAKAAEELRLMTINYERLAEHLEAVSYPADED